MISGIRQGHVFRNYGQNEFFLTEDAAFRIVFVSERKHRPMADVNALHHRDRSSTMDPRLVRTIVAAMIVRPRDASHRRRSGKPRNGKDEEPGGGDARID